jgi:2-oxoisovalerate dehydrogenase E2 component (dihydrolipoyl transacylase)
VAVGDTVSLNQPLCLVETAKAEVEVPSPYAGEVLVLGGDEGQTLKVGALLARIAPATGVADPPTTPASESEPEPTPEPERTSAPSPERQPTLVGYGHDASIDRSRRAGRAATATTTRTRPGAAVGARRRGEVPRKPITKPPVRLLARRLGIDLDDLVPGSGPGGVVTRSDVEAAATQPATAPERSTAPDSPSTQTIPVRGVRARIAEHLTRSRAEIPDATASVVADCTRLLEVRASLNAHAERRGLDPVVTPFSLLCRLVVQSLQAVPILNSTFDEAGPEIRVHNGVHLGIGTATERGLVVTVVHGAHDLAVHELSAEMARLVEGARAGTLTPSELTGSTFTVSNFGALGLDDGVPIVNHPEAAILGVGSIRPRPHVVDDQVVARPTASLTLAFDHRVCDGAEAAGFLTGLRDLIEAPELALLTR